MLLFLVGFGSACDLPRDPADTYEHVRGDTLHVGISENPPWTLRRGDAATGVEAAFVQQLARGLDAEVEWHWGTLEDHLAALEHFELDLAVGGLTMPTPWAKKVGLTNPYFVDTVTVGVPAGSPLPSELDGLRVAVRPASAFTAHLEEQGARPVRRMDLRDVSGPVAASTWQLRVWGFTPSTLTVQKIQHVMAVPPGENGWLMYLEGQLARWQPDRIERQLHQTSPL